jgi:hypothetical protein
MLKQVAEGVWTHNSEFLESKSIVVQGQDGMLLIDPGITGSEMADLADDLRELGRPVAAGFSTHPHWDHVLWYAKFGDVPRYSTARCAANIKDLLSKADWKNQVAGVLPPDISEQIPVDTLFGQITGLTAKTISLRWSYSKMYQTTLKYSSPVMDLSGITMIFANGSSWTALMCRPCKTVAMLTIRV